MIYINEWFPNPVGKDDGEFVELYNSGAATMPLGGYSLGTAVKKKFSLSGYAIPPGDYLLLGKKQTKLTLKNTDGGLWLYGPSGAIMDHGAFEGNAQAGKSFNRVVYGGAGGGAGGVSSDARPQAFAWTDPTPGAKNRTVDTAVTVRNYPLNVSLAKHVSPAQFTGMLLGTAVILAGIFIYIIQKNEDLQKLFFGGNKETW